MDAPHAPVAGRLSRLLGPLRITGQFWFRIHELAVRIIPGWGVPIVIHVSTFFFWILLRGIRRAIASNLAVALGPAGWWETEKRIHRTMLEFAWSLTERYERLTAGVEMHTEVENLEAWKETTAGDTGVILATAHLGNWEMGSALPTTRERRRVHLVREEELDPRAQDFIRKLLLEKMGPLYTTHFATGSPRLVLELAEALGRGEIVALQADRPRRGGRTLESRLFGRPFELPRGPLVLARTTGSSILPVFVFRNERRSYRVCFGDLIRVSATTDRVSDLRTAADRLSQSIESAILREPFQWYCFRQLWPDRAD